MRVDVKWIVVVTTVVDEPLPKVYVRMLSMTSVVIEEGVSAADILALLNTSALPTEPVPTGATEVELLDIG